MSSCSIVLLLITLLNIALSTAYHGSGNTTDRDALLAIKANLHDPKGFLRSWNHSVHFCEWEGVTCGRLHKRVTVLNLRSRGLSGSLSPHVGNLSFLNTIELGSNNFQGTIPKEIGQLFRLRSLLLMNNSFSGEIPSNISRCTDLIVLNLVSNKLEGNLPKEFVSLSNLKTLEISRNNLRGEFPSFIRNLTSLQKLYAVSNLFEGSIPSTLGEMQNLRVLHLSDNKFSSTVPSSIYNLSSLIALGLVINKLVGPLPKDLGLRLPLIQELYFSYNNFSGRIPPSISNASQLSIAYFGYNLFTGELPDFRRNINLQVLDLDHALVGVKGDVKEVATVIHLLTNCSMLTELSISGNNLGGVIPSYVGNLSSQLREIWAADNSIHGIIPLGLGNLAKLEILDIGYNHFEGKIPNDICKLQNLRLLYLPESKLHGEIPLSIGNMSMLSVLSLHGNALEGTIPLSFGNCKNLLQLNLSNNNLTGTIPKELFNASPLSISLDLSNNLLVGSIPSEVGQLKNIAQMKLSKNKLNGEIPSELSSCTSLVDLYLESNFLNGSIPSTLKSLRGLQNLDLSNNNLSGQIPKFLETFILNTLNLSFNNFTGELPLQGVFANETAINVYGNIGLCGGIQVLRLPLCKTKSKRRVLSHFKIATIAITCSFFVASMLLLSIVCWRRNKKRHQSSQSSEKEQFVKVSYTDLVKATNGFSSINIVGTGSFGLVYKGILDKDEPRVAIKVLRLERYGASKSFVAECKAFRNIRHRNLLKIITSCSTIDFQGNDFKALVYEYMPNGSLEKWLHSNEESLNFGQKIDIAIDVAYALDYLHQQCGNPIIHCDLKPSNVLLDADMVAHVGDFGLAKFSILESTDENQSLSIGFKGTIGYAAPEYGLGNEVTTKGDIYSYGILLLEMFTGKSPIDPMFHGGLNLHNYAHRALPKDVMDIVDPKLVYDGEDSLVSVVKIGVACSMESSQDRMDLNDVIHQLQSLKSALTRGDLQNVPTH